jgi:hypothetical protein
MAIRTRITTNTSTATAMSMSKTRNNNHIKSSIANPTTNISCAHT